MNSDTCKACNFILPLSVAQRSFLGTQERACGARLARLLRPFQAYHSGISRSSRNPNGAKIYVVKKIRDWKLLDVNSRNAKSVASFKFKVFKHFLRNIFNSTIFFQTIYS